MMDHHNNNNNNNNNHNINESLQCYNDEDYMIHETPNNHTYDRNNTNDYYSTTSNKSIVTDDSAWYRPRGCPSLLSPPLLVLQPEQQEQEQQIIRRAMSNGDQIMMDLNQQNMIYNQLTIPDDFDSLCSSLSVYHDEDIPLPLVSLRPRTLSDGVSSTINPLYGLP